MSKRSKRSNGVMTSRGGPPCPRCQTATQMFEHKSINDQQLGQNYYYKRWYRCINPDCPTKQIVFDRDRVYHGKIVPTAYDELKNLVWDYLNEYEERVPNDPDKRRILRDRLRSIINFT